MPKYMKQLANSVCCFNLNDNVFCVILDCLLFIIFFQDCLSDSIQLQTGHKSF